MFWLLPGLGCIYFWTGGLFNYIITSIQEKGGVNEHAINVLKTLISSFRL